MDPVRVDKPSCPFCMFCVPSSSEQDMYSLMHHLELSHPESGTSLFQVLDERRAPSRNASLHSVRAARSRTPSDHGEEEEVYVECPLQCGEAVTLDELSSHMELHGAEGAAFDDPNGPRSREASPLPGGRRSTSTGPSRHLDVPQDSSEIYSPASGKTHRPHSAHKRSGDNYGLKDWKDLFLGPASRKTRATNIKARSTAVKRLGVSQDLARAVDIVLRHAAEVRARSPCLRSPNASLAQETAGTRCTNYGSKSTSTKRPDHSCGNCC